MSVKLGVATASGDGDSEVTCVRDVPEFKIADIEDVLVQYRGDIQQLPSMYSALKRNGQPLYKLARQGIEVERQPRPVTIYENRIECHQGDELRLYVECSKGTYIRTLVDDIGNSLGCGAHVSALRRLSVGEFTIEQCITFEKLQEARANGCLADHVLPTDTMVQDFPLVEFPRSSAYLVRQGQMVQAPPTAPKGGWVRLSQVDADGKPQFLGIGEIHDGRVSPRRLISLTHS